MCDKLRASNPTAKHIPMTNMMVVSVPGMSAPLFNQQSMPDMPAPPSNRQPIPGMPAPPSSQPTIPRTSRKAPPIHPENQSQWTVMHKKSEARSDMAPKDKD